jgi:phage/plasmid-associated DNA primase
VVKQGIKLSASMEKASNEFRTTTDPFGAWLDECTVEGSELWAAKGTMIRAFNHWAHENEKSSMDPKAFGLAMKHHRPNIADCQRTVAGQPRIWCYKSIGLKIDDGVM